MANISKIEKSEPLKLSKFHGKIWLVEKFVNFHTVRFKEGSYKIDWGGHSRDP